MSSQSRSRTALRWALACLVLMLAATGISAAGPASAAKPLPLSTRRPLDVVVVVDTSARKDPFQFRATKIAVAKVIQALPDSARIGLISSGTFPTVLRQPARDKIGMFAAIAALTPAGAA